jgi:hypothetical protein
MAYDRFKRLPSDLPTNTTHERLLARSYERTYLTLFNYDRGSALVQGDYLGITIKERKDLVGSVWQWASHPEAIQTDWLLAALVALRRDVVSSCAFVLYNFVAKAVFGTAWCARSCDQARCRAQVGINRTT